MLRGNRSPTSIRVKHPADAGTAGVLTEDEARRIASNIAKLPSALSAIAFYSLYSLPPWVMPWGGW